LLRSALGFLIFLPFTAVMALAVLAALPFSRIAGPTAVMRAWAKAILAMAGVRLCVEGRERVDPATPIIYMANHASMIDIPLLIAALPGHLRFVFKKSLLWAPFVGPVIYAMGMVPIDRGGGQQKASESLARAGRQIRKGKAVLIFPEGTRTRTGEMLPFKKGGFYLAIQERIPIVPVSISNSRMVGGRDSFLIKTGRVDVAIHDPIDPGPYTIADRMTLVHRVRDVIAAGIQPDRAEAESPDPN